MGEILKNYSCALLLSVCNVTQERLAWIKNSKKLNTTKMATRCSLFAWLETGDRYIRDASSEIFSLCHYKLQCFFKKKKKTKLRRLLKKKVRNRTLPLVPVVTFKDLDRTWRVFSAAKSIHSQPSPPLKVAFSICKFAGTLSFVLLWIVTQPVVIKKLIDVSG